MREPDKNWIDNGDYVIEYNIVLNNFQCFIDINLFRAQICLVQKHVFDLTFKVLYSKIGVAMNRFVHFIFMYVFWKPSFVFFPFQAIIHHSTQIIKMLVRPRDLGGSNSLILNIQLKVFFSLKWCYLMLLVIYYFMLKHCFKSITKLFLLILGRSNILIRNIQIIVFYFFFT